MPYWYCWREGVEICQDRATSSGKTFMLSRESFCYDIVIESGNGQTDVQTRNSLTGFLQRKDVPPKDYNKGRNLCKVAQV